MMRAIANPTARRLLRVLLPAVVIPATVFVGTQLAPEKIYALTALVVAILALVLFACGFEEQKTGTRRLVLVAALTALSVAGRFFPVLKPVTAITVLAALYLGGEAGFLVGALSAVLSNFYFGQGPWTPFQMLAWGLIGLCAGLCARPLRRSRMLLLGFGLLSGVFYSLVLDVWTVLWYNGSFSLPLYLTALGTALPHTLVYAVSNLLFLLAFAKPFGEKLERIQKKYGI